MRKDLKTTGFTLAPNPAKIEFEETDIVFKLDEESRVNGYGDFFTTIGSRKIIETYWQDLKDSNPGQNIDDKVIHINIGREMLLMILSQPGCEGIRLYHARAVEKIKSETETRYQMKGAGHTTLVAVGIDSNGNELKVSLSGDKSIDKFKDISFLSDGVLVEPDVMQSETNPPGTYGHAVNKSFVPDEIYGVAEAFRKFLGR